jgi:hypothetical protein
MDTFDLTGNPKRIVVEGLNGFGKFCSKLYVSGANITSIDFE